MNSYIQLFINLLAIVGGILGVIAFQDVRRKRYKLLLFKSIENVIEKKDSGGAQFFIKGDAFKFVLINSGLIPIYPLKFLILTDGKFETEIFPPKPYSVLIPGRSIRYSIGKYILFKRIKEQYPQELDKKHVSLQMIVQLEDDFICKSKPLKVEVPSFLG
jgi:hypothetical protein